MRRFWRATLRRSRCFIESPIAAMTGHRPPDNIFGVPAKFRGTKRAEPALLRNLSEAGAFTLEAVSK